MKIGRGGWVGELRGVEAQLLVWLAWAEESCSGGSAAASSSPGLRMNGGAGLGKLGRERARERGNALWNFQGCWCARKMVVRGAALLGPRRRRGGSRAKLGGGAWQGEEVPAQKGWVQGFVEVPREAAAKLEVACGRP